MQIQTHALTRESLVARTRAIAAQPHPLSSTISADAVRLEGQIERFDGATVGEMRDSAESLSKLELAKAGHYRDASRAFGAVGLVAAATSVAGAVAGNNVMMLAGTLGFLGFGAGAVLYDHTSRLYSEASAHTQASIDRLDTWAGFIANQA